MLLSKQANSIDLFITQARHPNIVIYYISQSYFHLTKKVIRNNSNILIFLRQTLRDTILLFHDRAGLDINLEEWKRLCLKAREIEYEYLQTNRFAKVGEGRYTIRNCNTTTYIKSTSETKHF